MWEMSAARFIFTMRKSGLPLLQLRRAINVPKILDFYLQWSKRSVVVMPLPKAGVFAIVVRETLHIAWRVRGIKTVPTK
jgi:hypothetical protein